MGVHGEVTTARNIIDITGTWHNQFGKEQLKATLKDAQYNVMTNFNLFGFGKAIKEGWKLSSDQEGLTLTKESAKHVFDIKIKNGVIFCADLQRDQEVSALTNIGAAVSMKRLT